MSFFDPVIEELRQRPIPDLAPVRTAREGYRDSPLDLAHPLNSEKLVDLRDYGIEGINYYNRSDNPPYYQVIPGSIPDLLARESVAEKLSAVDRFLRRYGLKLHVHDAWRPTEVQIFMHDVWMPAYLKRKYPHLEGEALVREVEKYWAAPTTSPNSPAPHNTGAAVDLTLYTLERNEPLFMGTIFDDASPAAHTDAFEFKPPQSFSDEEAQKNRRLLYWAMTEAGFANTPFERWHYSWGDQLWARLSGAKTAHYGVASHCRHARDLATPKRSFSFAKARGRDDGSEY